MPDPARRVTLSAAAALTTAVLPVFLLSTSSPRMEADLGFGEDGTGVLVTILFVAAGLAAAAAGRLTERVGAHVTLPLGVAVAGLATGAVALVGRWWQLAVLFAVVGITVALIDTGAARRFADALPSGRQGTAFGIKEASVPGASLLAGLALPTLGGWLGWRGTFALAPLIAVLVLIALPRGDRRTQGGPRPTSGATDHLDVAAPTSDAEVARRESGALVVLAVGVGLGAGTATAAAAFLVPALLAGGAGPTYAGTVLAVVSVASIAARIVLGRMADDPTRRPLLTMTLAIGIGAAGTALLATGSTAAGTIGALLVFAGGWGWTGLAFLAVVRSRPDAPAAAAGTVLMGLALGGAIGPSAFAATAARTSFGTAWLAATAALVVAAVAVAVTIRPLSPAGSPGR